MRGDGNIRESEETHAHSMGRLAKGRKTRFANAALMDVHSVKMEFDITNDV